MCLFRGLLCLLSSSGASLLCSHPSPPSSSPPARSRYDWQSVGGGMGETTVIFRADSAQMIWKYLMRLYFVLRLFWSQFSTLKHIISLWMYSVQNCPVICHVMLCWHNMVALLLHSTGLLTPCLVLSTAILHHRQGFMMCSSETWFVFYWDRLDLSKTNSLYVIKKTPQID